MIRLGIDIGSTTVKMAALNDDGQLIFSGYRRHGARAREVMAEMLKGLAAETDSRGGPPLLSVRLTGSVGMGMAERLGLPFVQEVVAATKAIRRDHPEVSSMIDIGGEDAKVVFFHGGEASDLRMNGNCAGGTGAFIDQMAVLLGVGPDELGSLAMNAHTTYPIASRCGVFCKTDIQNLIAKNVPKEDIAASIFHAVAVQTIVTLAHGCDITPPLLFCGGPLTFIPALRKAFVEYMHIEDSDIILPSHATLLPAIGSALAADEKQGPTTLQSLINNAGADHVSAHSACNAPAPIFNNPEEYEAWKRRISRPSSAEGNSSLFTLHSSLNKDIYIGIDSGSTTTKIVATDEDANILFSYYRPNSGNPIETVEKGLRTLMEEAEAKGGHLNIKGSCSTGYGEDLIKAAFQLDHGIVETMAHYIAARRLRPDVSFILDIGGQDMKAIFVTDGVIDRIEINEACSSGCGSFIETFAKTLGYSAPDFAQAACQSQAPCDLGTRCTVFMNSKVKQVLREGASINDISAGLAYSVVRNCLYKVLKLKDLSALGKSIVVQGGTMRNDAIVRALELLTGAEVSRHEAPELMGALGCAIYARQASADGPARSLQDMLSKARFTSRHLNCHGCDNQCLVVRYTFENGKHYYSGNRCEKVFTNGERENKKGRNAYDIKNRLLFGDHVGATGDHSGSPLHGRPSPLQRIGIPRALGMYEDYPFWATLFRECGFEVVLSSPSRFSAYEQSARMVMSDNICFPAKLVHSHIKDLIDKGVDRVFMPFVVYERPGSGSESFNCPIVAGYGEVVKGVQGAAIPIDTPSISFKRPDLLLKQCRDYLAQFHVPMQTLRRALRKALEAWQKYHEALRAANEDILAGSGKRLTILLAGRPYHADPLIQHKVSDMLADMGINVTTEDIVRAGDHGGSPLRLPDAHFLAQWSYPNRILQAAGWCARQGSNVQFVQMTSFGCGPDAFLVDEVKDVLARHGKVLTLLKLDDINNIGSMKLRVRSLVESLKIAQTGKAGDHGGSPLQSPPIFGRGMEGRKILVPYFTPFVSPFIPAVMRMAGYEVENLPLSSQPSADFGLQYANNEVCYPATLVVGDIVAAIKSGRYDHDKIAVAMTQTGGQCRASNYVALIKRALANAGIDDVPVVAITLGSDLVNNQPGFHPDWLRVLPTAFRVIIYGDTIAKMYYAAVAHTRVGAPHEEPALAKCAPCRPGQAEALRDEYIQRGVELVEQGRAKELIGLIAEAARDFDAICSINSSLSTLHSSLPKVGVVGEIFLKFNPFAQRDVTSWLVGQGVEVAPPLLADFFLQAFVNRKVNEEQHLEKKSPWGFVYDMLYKLVRRQYKKVNRNAAAFRYFTPFTDIFQEAEEASRVINLAAQFGEGWLLPAEIMTYARQGINSVVSLQPFGCIANHIVARGMEKRIKALWPDLNMLSLDFDSGVSDVNVTNRLLLFIDNARRQQSPDPAPASQR